MLTHGFLLTLPGWKEENGNKPNFLGEIYLYGHPTTIEARKINDNSIDILIKNGQFEEKWNIYEKSELTELENKTKKDPSIKIRVESGKVPVNPLAPEPESEWRDIKKQGILPFTPPSKSGKKVWTVTASEEVEADMKIADYNLKSATFKSMVNLMKMMQNAEILTP